MASQLMSWSEFRQFLPGNSIANSHWTKNIAYFFLLTPLQFDQHISMVKYMGHLMVCFSAHCWRPSKISFFIRFLAESNPRLHLWTRYLRIRFTCIKLFFLFFPPFPPPPPPPPPAPPASPLSNPRALLSSSIGLRINIILGSTLRNTERTQPGIVWVMGVR